MPQSSHIMTNWQTWVGNSTDVKCTEFTLSIPMLDDKQGVAGSVNNTIGLNINQDTEHKNWGHWTCLGPGS